MQCILLLYNVRLISYYLFGLLVRRRHIIPLSTANEKIALLAIIKFNVHFDRFHLANAYCTSINPERFALDIFLLFFFFWNFR